MRKSWTRPWDAVLELGRAGGLAGLIGAMSAGSAQAAPPGSTALAGGAVAEVPASAGSGAGSGGQGGASAGGWGSAGYSIETAPVRPAPVMIEPDAGGRRHGPGADAAQARSPVRIAGGERAAPAQDGMRGDEMRGDDPGKAADAAGGVAGVGVRGIAGDVPLDVRIRYALGRSAGASRARADALADSLRRCGYAVDERAVPAMRPGPDGVAYVFAEDRGQASEIALLAFGTDQADRLPAEAVHDPRPGLVEINLRG